MGGGMEIHHAVLCRILGLYDAAAESGLEGRHIQAWLEFEHEAMRLGVPAEIERDDLEALVGASEVVPGRQVQIGTGEIDDASGVPRNWLVAEAYRENGRTTRFVVEDGLSEKEARKMASGFNENLHLLGITEHWAEAVPDRALS